MQSSYFFSENKVLMQIYRDFIYTDLIPKQPKICKNLNSIICQMNGYLCLLIKTLLTLACLSWFFCFNYLFVYLFIYLFFLVLNIKLLNGFLRAVTRWNAWQHELQMQSFCFFVFFWKESTNPDQEGFYLYRIKIKKYQNLPQFKLYNLPHGYLLGLVSETLLTFTYLGYFFWITYLFIHLFFFVSNIKLLKQRCGFFINKMRVKW